LPLNSRTAEKEEEYDWFNIKLLWSRLTAVMCYRNNA